MFNTTTAYTRRITLFEKYVRFSRRFQIAIIAIATGMLSTFHATLVSGETITLMKDIATEQQEHASSPREFHLLNGTVLFSACTQALGCELWKSKGTRSSTVLVKDIAPGVEDSDPHGFVEVNGKAYFAANGGAAGIELWRTDGTTAGTQRVKDIVPGSLSGNPIELTALDGILYFFANDAATGWELWRSDGTQKGTQRVAELSPGKEYYGMPSNLVAADGSLYFSAHDGNDDYLWKSNGTANGTTRLKKIDANSIVELNGNIYFVGTNPQHGAEIWRSDGTAEGTYLLKDTNPGTDDGLSSFISNQFAIIGNSLVFFTRVGNYTSSNWPHDELWRSDGTQNGTFRIKNFSGVSNEGKSLLGNAIAGRAYLNIGTDVWKTDGTSKGTTLLKAGVNAAAESQSRFNPTSIGANVFFAGIGKATNAGDVLWKTDGTPKGTVKVKSIPDSLTSAIRIGTKLFFSGLEPWISDGTSSGTRRLKEIEANRGNSNPSHLVVGSDGNVWFSAENSKFEQAIWTSNRTRQSTNIKLELGPAPAGVRSRVDPSVVGTIDSVTFIYAWSSAGPGLWAFNTSTGRTTLVASTYGDQGPSGDWGTFDNFTVSNGLLYFTAWDPDGSYAEIYRTDGTRDGTFSIAPESWTVSPVRALNKYNFFLALDPFGENDALWKTNGTGPGTTLVKKLPGMTNEILESAGGLLYFSVSTTASGLDLWKSDGTTRGTVRVKTLCSPTTLKWKSYQWLVKRPNNFFRTNDITYFSADDCVSGEELWRTNGFAPGTYQVKDVFPGNNSGSPSNFIDVSGKFYFVASDKTHGRELWTSNGTRAGTKLVKDIYPGLGSSYAGTAFLHDCEAWRCATPAMADLNGILYFTANRGGSGTELWKSNGTAAGTVMVRNIVPGSGGSAPAHLVRAGNAIYFSAYHYQYGRELWRLTQ